jgi:hypothetical protein
MRPHLEREAVCFIHAIDLPVGGALHLPGSTWLVVVDIKYGVPKATGLTDHRNGTVPHGNHLQKA